MVGYVDSLKKTLPAPLAENGVVVRIDKATVDKVLFLTTKRVAQEATHWSIELKARYAEVTPWQVPQIWKRQICARIG